jgi:putative transposase
LVKPHPIYLALGEGVTNCELNYKLLFDTPILESGLEEIRDATNKAWVLGEGRFKQQIEKSIKTSG